MSDNGERMNDGISIVPRVYANQIHGACRLPQSAAQTHLWSICSSHSPVRVSKILTRKVSSNTKRASTFTSILSRVNNGPLQRHPRDYESSLYHVCVWSSGCAVWIPTVYNASKCDASTLSHVILLKMRIICYTLSRPSSSSSCVCWTYNRNLR